MKIPILSNRLKKSFGHSDVGEMSSNEPGASFFANPQNRTVTTTNEVDIIPTRLKWDKMLNSRKLDRKKSTEMTNLNTSLSTPVKALKESANMMIMDVPALNRSIVNMKTVTAYATLPKLK
jgi:hypothetical protein